MNIKDILHKINDFLSESILSKLQSGGVGIVLVSYLVLCFAWFEMVFWLLIAEGVIDLILVWKDFETISQRIHSWLGQKGDMIVNIVAFIFNIWCMREETLVWSEYAVASAFWIIHGHLWWYKN